MRYEFYPYLSNIFSYTGVPARQRAGNKFESFQFASMFSIIMFMIVFQLPLFELFPVYL